MKKYIIMVSFTFLYIRTTFLFHSFSRVLSVEALISLHDISRGEIEAVVAQLRSKVGSWRLESAPASPPASLILACSVLSLPRSALHIITSRLSTKSLSPCIILTTFHPPPLNLYTFHSQEI